MSFWNAKVDLATLRSTTGSRVTSRSSAALFLQFNFLHEQKYINWVNPSQYVAKQANAEIQSEDSGLTTLSLCDASTVYNGVECVSAFRYPGFTSSFSQSSLSLSSLTLDT